MAQANYKISKPLLVIGNNTAGNLPAVAGAYLRLYYTDKRKDGLKTDDIIILPGTYLIFRDVDFIDVDTVDHGNLSIAEYLDTDVAFFLK